MEVFANNPISLSDCGQYFSYCTLDGQLKIWDTLSARLKQEYTPSSHLSATCVTISWPQRTNVSLDGHSEGSPKKKRKRKISSDISQDVFDLELLALGTMNGTILLYSVVKSDLYSQLTSGHDDRVNDISWLTNNDSLFSCSNDKHVIEWSITTAKVKKKWNPDNKIVSAICAIDSKNILIAGNSIKWLNWETNTVLRHFSGHASEVKRLKYVRIPDNEDVEGSYFLSSANGDRLINAWQLKNEKTRQKTSNSLASFLLDDEPISIDITPSKSKQPILISVVTKSGFMYIFEHIFNGHRKTPLSPKIKLQIMTGPDSKKVSSKQQMIFSSQIYSNKDILLIYGTLFNPVFERISFEKCEKNTVLMRKDSTSAANASLLVDSSFTKIKSPLKPKNATVVGPAGMAPTRQTVPTKAIENNQISNSINELNDKKDIKSNQTKPKQLNETLLTFEERLESIEKPDLESVPTASSSHQTTSESLTIVLEQGLKSKDKRMLETVFNNTDEKVIRNTLKKFPIECISMLLNELQNCLFNKSENTIVYIKWLEQLLNLRLTFLMTLPNVEEEFAPLMELMNARTHILDRIYRLKGRLNLMISQIRTNNNTTSLSREKPVIEYESSSESSEDEDIIDGRFKDTISDSDEEMISEDGEEEKGKDEDHHNSDDSIDGDNYMSEDIDEEYDSNKVSNNDMNDIETD